MALATRGSDAFADEEIRLIRTRTDDTAVAWLPPAGEDELFATTREGDLTYEDAKPRLNQEIKAALDDLECGRDFYPAYRPRENTIERQVHDRYGLTPFSWIPEDW